MTLGSGDWEPKIDFKPGLSTEAWQILFDSLKITEVVFFQIIGTIALHEKPAEVVVRLLSPGLGGAKVVVMSYHDSSTIQHDWVVKLLPADAGATLDGEYRNTLEFGRRLYPNLEVRQSSGGAIAYAFYKVKADFRSFYRDAVTTEEVCDCVNNVFNSLKTWYQDAKPDLLSFFDLYPLSNSLKTTILDERFEDILTAWSQLEGKWPKTRGVIKCISHGDLNPTNILLDSTQKPVVIDFATTGYHHWPLDFARLERHLRFVVSPDLAKRVSEIADSGFHFKVPTGVDLRIRIATAAIQQIRKNAERFFRGAFHTGEAYPTFEDEYFHMLAEEQVRLFGSPTRPKSQEVTTALAESTRRLIAKLLDEPPRDYFFGYFCCETHGRERVLARVTDSGGLAFPIAGFRPRSTSIHETIESEIGRFVNSNDLVRTAYFNAGFSQPQIIDIHDGKASPVILQSGNRRIPVHPFFFKVHLNEEMDVRNRHFQWFDKTEFLQITDQTDSDTSCLISAICRDWIVSEFGQKVLNCVDILVFRENNGQYEFLMLNRNKKTESLGGWEYPKGGLEYHETLREGAIRELLEETGLRSTGGFRFGGYLGYQTADVTWRNKDKYDVLRVHGLTYLFYGREQDIEMLRQEEEGHSEFKWMSLESARERIWVGDYGPRFFDRWREQRMSILRTIARPVSLAFQLTEECPIGCRFCHRRSVGEDNATVDEHKQLIDILSERKVLRLTVTGGEPTLPKYKETAFQILKYAHQKKIHTCLSTTGLGLSEPDIATLDTFLDQMLLSMHTLDSESALNLYEGEKTAAAVQRQIANVLNWTQASNIIIEVCTVVSKVNLKTVVSLGMWLFDRHPGLFWRLDEYYVNGIQSNRRDAFELASAEFEECIEKVKDAFPNEWIAGRIRFSTKEARLAAPDFMITPKGNLVTSAGNDYSFRGSMEDLMFLELKNRRPWSEYRDYIRTDWNW